jgi:predicted amidohydrolase YtcJ
MRSSTDAVILTSMLGFGLGGCAQASDVGEPADVVFVGDNIVTMDSSAPTVEAVAVRGETIVAAGSMDDVMALEGASTRVVDLGDQALLPGFIDAHGHFLSASRSLESLQLHPPPVGDVNNIDDLVRKVQAWIVENDIPAGEAVVGGGYDDSLLEEGRHPTRYDLDRASTDHPIILTHVSGHLRASNSAALAAGNVTADTPDPPGGYIRRVEGSMEPNGVMEETAGGLLGGGGRGAPQSPEEFEDMVRKSIDVWLGYGITTIQNGGGTGAATVQSL